MIFYGIHYSPWSMRATWVIAHHALQLEYREYLSIAMTPWLRMRLRDFRNPITVPILIDGETVLRDSLDISRYLDERGSGPTLFSDTNDVIATWTATAEQIAEAGRVVTTFAVQHDPDATRENIPAQIPKPLRGIATPIVGVGASYLARKYGFTEADVEPAERQIRAGLERVANRLVESDALGEQFGWPDIVVASALQFVRPAESWARMGTASRRCWTRPQLADEFADVLAWRDRLLQDHLPGA